MCLSLKLVGNCVKFSAFLVLLLGVIGVICGVYIGRNDIMVSSVEDTKKSIMVVTIVFSVFLILIGLSGIIGAWRKSARCLLIYNIGIGIFFVAFLIISIVAFAVFKKYYAIDIKDAEICKSQGWLSPINDVAVKGESYLCSKSCACNSHTPFTLLVSNVTNSSNTNTSNASANTSNSSKTSNTSSNTSSKTSNTTENTSNTTTSNTTSNRTWNFSANGSVRAQDCPNYAKDFSLTERELAVTLELLERQFKCAGICYNSEFYTFSDINTGKPIDDCSTTIIDIFVSYSKKIGACTIVMTILLFLTLIASFCLCCHPEKRKEEGGFYHKMTSI